MGERRYRLGQKWQTTPAPSQMAFTAASENGCPPPDALSSLPPPAPASPTLRDMLVGGEGGGVPAFREREHEVTPRAVSQPSHLQQALWGQVPGVLPTWCLQASLDPPLACCQETCPPGWSRQKRRSRPQPWLPAQGIARKTLLLPAFGRGWPSLRRAEGPAAGHSPESCR